VTLPQGRRAQHNEGNQSPAVAEEGHRSHHAIERGPIVYTIESVDNGGDVFNVVLPDAAVLTAQQRPDLLGGVTVITGKALGLYPGDDGRTVVTKEQEFVAVPYNVWSNRGEDRMAVWLPRKVSLDFTVP